MYKRTLTRGSIFRKAQKDPRFTEGFLLKNPGMWACSQSSFPLSWAIPHKSGPGQLKDLLKRSFLMFKYVQTDSHPWLYFSQSSKRPTVYRGFFIKKPRHVGLLPIELSALLGNPAQVRPRAIKRPLEEVFFNAKRFLFLF